MRSPSFQRSRNRSRSQRSRWRPGSAFLYTPEPLRRLGELRDWNSSPRRRCAGRCSRRCGFSSSVNALGNGDLHLGTWECGEIFLQWNVFVPSWHYRETSSSAAHGELSVPLSNESSHAGEALSAARVAEPAHAAHHGLFERHSVVPSVGTRPSHGGFERFSEPYAGIAHSDYQHATSAEPFLPAITVYRDPAAAFRVLHDVLARLRQRHSESHGRGRVELELGDQNGLRPLLNLVHDRMDVLARVDGRYFEQYA